MLRRLTRLAGTTAAAILLTQAPIAVTPVATAGSCNLFAQPFVGATAGVLDSTTWQRWHQTTSVGQTNFRVDIDQYYSFAEFYDTNCNLVCWSSYGYTHTCTVDATGIVDVVVGTMWSDPATYTITAIPGVPSTPAQCSDGIDNDLNGTKDYPSDPGCSWYDDPSESSPPTGCATAAGVPSCVVIQSGTSYQSYTVQGPRTYSAGTHRVAGSIDLYRFALPTGGSAVVPCVVLTANATQGDSCKAAGGTFVSRVIPLYDQTVTQPGVAVDNPLTTVRVCHATYTVTVARIGVENFPAYSLC